jgi:hypothetical protein
LGWRHIFDKFEGFFFGCFFFAKKMASSLSAVLLLSFLAFSLVYCGEEDDDICRGSYVCLGVNGFQGDRRATKNNTVAIDFVGQRIYITPTRYGNVCMLSGVITGVDCCPEYFGCLSNVNLYTARVSSTIYSATSEYSSVTFYNDYTNSDQLSLIFDVCEVSDYQTCPDCSCSWGGIYVCQPTERKVVKGFVNACGNGIQELNCCQN